MALGSREILLVIRARDEASRSLRFLTGNLARVDQAAAAAASAMIARGTALFSVGAGLTAVGGALAAALASATQFAQEYDLAARMTLTQTDNVVVSLDKLKRMAIDVGREIPVPLMDLQGALYDIFSTIDVSVPEAQHLLESFAKEAVTGQADIRRAAMTTIAILNAFQIPISEVTRLQDVQFQAVRKGAMTYEELSNNIGKAIPAAVQAGQEFETLAGMMSFLTRGGLNVSMSATSAARALEAMSHPATVKKLEEMGITVKDASGDFLPMIDIFEQINKELEGLGDAERNEVIQELLKGGGNRIQARRFWIRALSDFDELRQHVDWMVNSEGAFEEAYKTMLDSPAMRVELLKNRFAQLRIEIGERLLPVKMFLVDVALRLLDAWDRLSPSTKDLIVKMAALTSGLLILFGVVTMISGAIMLISGAFKILGGVGAIVSKLATPFKVLAAVIRIAGGSFTKLLGVFGPVGAAISAIITIVGLLIANWDTVVAAAQTAWTAIKQTWERLSNWFQTEILPIFEGFGRGIRDAWDTISQAFSNAWDSIREGFDRAASNIGQAWDNVVAKFKPATDAIGDTFDYIAERWEYIKPGLTDFFNTLGDIADAIANNLAPYIEAFGDALGDLADTISQFVGPVLEGLGDIISGIVEDVSLAISTLVAALTGDWDTVIANMQELGTNTAEGFRDAFDTVFDGWEIAWGNLRSRISEWWDGVKEGILEKFEELKDEVPGKLSSLKQDILDKTNEIKEQIGPAWEEVKQEIEEVWEDLPTIIGTALGGAADAIADWLRDIGFSLLINIQKLFANVVSAVASALPGILNSVGETLGRIVAWFAELPDKIWNALGNLGETVRGRWREMSDISWEEVSQTIVRIVQNVLTWPNQIANALIGLAETLRQKAIEAGEGFIDGLGPDTIAIMRVMGEWMWNILDALLFLPQKLFLWGVQATIQFIAGLSEHIGELSKIPLEWSARIVLGLLSLPGQLFQKGWDSFLGFVNGLLNRPSMASDATKATSTNALMATGFLPLALFNRGNDGTQKLSSGLTSSLPATALTGTVNSAVRAINFLNGVMYMSAISAMHRFVAGIYALSGAVSGAVRSVAAGGASAAYSVAGSFWSAGLNLSASLGRGIYAGGSYAISAAYSVAASALRAAKSALGIGSPSKAFLAIGDNISTSMAEGIRRSIPLIERAGIQMSDAVINAQHTAMRTVDMNGGSTFSGGYMSRVPVAEQSRSGDINITVNTEEIDPVMHAQRLGFELQLRAGDI